MKLQDEIYNELKELAPGLSKLAKINVFSVPANYFLQFQNSILKQALPIQFDVQPTSEPLFAVPVDYFENFAGNILNKIKSADSDDDIEFTLLYPPHRESPFSIPPAYFEAFPATIMDLVKPPAKVVVMLNRKSMVWNCLAAAMITGIVAVSALWTSNTSFQRGAVTESNTAPLISDALRYKSEQQINEGIAGLSDNDIVKYLESTGSNADEEALASGIPEKDLPDEQDYLSDDNTLQLFLGKANGENNQN